MRRGLALWVCVWLLGSVAPGAAQQAAEALQPQSEAGDDERAHELYLRGDRLYAEGDYEGAIAAFEESYELSGRPLMLFNLANAYERAGRLEHAIAALRRYAPHAPAYEHESIARRIAHLEERLPSPQPASREKEVEASATPNVRSGGRGPSDVTEVAGDEPTGRERSARPRLRRARRALLAASAGSLLAGGAAGVVALRARKQVRAQCFEGFCPADARSAVERDRTASLVADVGLGLGLLGLTTGLSLWVWGGPSAPEEAPATASRGALLQVRGRF